MEPRDVALGLLVFGVHAGRDTVRISLAPVRLAARAPVAGPALRRTGRDLAASGRLARSRALLRLETVTAGLLESPELQRAIDRVLSGQLTDALARSLGQNHVVERIATEVIAGIDLDRVVSAVLDDERTARAVEHALASPGLERLVVQVLDSRLVDELTERLLDSPELQRVVGHVAASPEVRAALSHHTETLGEEMVSDVRRRAQRIDELTERTVRGWLRRPRPSAT
jgi:hypothetical protein